jgi:hypothetical protein
MLSFFQQYGYTILIIAALALIFALLIRSLVRGKKTGKSSCCGGCAGCAMAGACHAQSRPTAPSEQADAPAASAEDANNKP